jgi:serine O-acetyltransferase
VIDPMNIYRLSYYLHVKNYVNTARVLRDLNFFLFNTYLPPTCKIGAGSILGYKGMGTVIHANSVIGENCVIGHGVTLGTAMPYSTNKLSIGPRVGNNTFIGSGAKILGDIQIGSNCTIAAGAIVLKNLPDCSVVVGAPARVVGVNGNDYQAIVRAGVY